MNTLDQNDLESIRTMAQRRLNSNDRRKRMQPLYDAMTGRLQSFAGSGAIEIRAGAVANTRRATRNLEESVEQFPDQLRQIDARNAAALASARRRTDALRKWLESLE